jgi:hypothetical protein
VSSQRSGRPCSDQNARDVEIIRVFAADPDITSAELLRRVGGRRTDVLRIHRALKELRTAWRSS